MQHKDSDSEEQDEIREEDVREVENFENKPKSNLDETEAVNLGDAETVKETRISIHLSPTEKEEYICFLKKYDDIFAWSFDDLTEVYVDNVIIKSKRVTYHIADLRKVFDRLRRYKVKLNLAKYAFGVPAGKLLGFIVSRWGIELDPSKVKAIQELPPQRSKKDVMSFLGHLNYCSCFIAQSTIIYEPNFKILRKDAEISWTEDCQKAFDKIKEYMSTPPVLVPPEPWQPLLLYISVLDGTFGCVLGQHDKTGRKEQAIYYLSKKFTPYEAPYSLLECTCCSLTWTTQKLRNYFYDYTTYLISRMDPLKYIFQKPMPTGSVIGEDITEVYCGSRMFFDGAVNFKGVGIGEVLVSEKGQHYIVSAKLRFPCTNNMAEYESCILGLNLAIDMNIQELLVIGDLDLLVHQVQGEWATNNTKILPYLYHVHELMKRFTKIEFKHVPRIQNEFANALATLSSMIQNPDKNFIDPTPVRIHNQPAYCAHVEEETDGEPWLHDIREYLVKGEYLEHANHTQKRTLWRLSNHFFHNGGNLYRRTPDLGFLRCVDAKEASKLLEEIHAPAVRI
ncbi:uncharacterized protein [Nicotiana sylvestris]|uniref:uncharacterized protein n=1 Tax=Nicotiana sylvestris TaxID=4096 RepID=UPI00388CC1FE